MDINLLVLNLGNSRLGIGTFIDGKLDFATRIPHANRADWAGKIADAFNDLLDEQLGKKRSQEWNAMLTDVTAAPKPHWQRVRNDYAS